MYCFVFKRFAMGGGELLIEHIALYLMRRGNEVSICCNTIDRDAAKSLQKQKINYYIIDKWNTNKEWKEFLDRFTEVNIVTFDWFDFAHLYGLQHSKKKTTFYAIHYAAFAFETYNRFKKSIINRIILHNKLKCLPYLIKQGSNFCMDEHTQNYTFNAFNQKLENECKAISIVRVPEVINDIDASELEKRAYMDDFNILTITRADFPFKGYLLSLIDFCAKIDTHRNIRLDIISYGPNIDQVHLKINELSENQKRRIYLHGRMEYEELNAFFAKAKLYIGMGTTVIDAAQRGVLALPVKSATYSLVTGDFFHENYRYVEADHIESDRTEELISRALNFSPDEYLKYSMMSRKLVKEHYSVEKVSETVVDILNNVPLDQKDKTIKRISNMYRVKELIKKIMYKDILRGGAR